MTQMVIKKGTQYRNLTGTSIVHALKGGAGRIANRRAIHMVDKGNENAGLELFKIAAMKGSTSALYNLGLTYHRKTWC